MTYVAVNGTAAYNRAKYKPHDKTLIRIGQNTHNAAANAVAAASLVNMVTIPANSVLIGAWCEIVVDSAAANVEVDLGLAGGAEFDDGFESNQAAGTVTTPESDQNVTFVKAANQVTLVPNNALEWNTGTLKVTACWIELDALGAAN